MKFSSQYGWKSLRFIIKAITVMVLIGGASVHTYIQVKNRQRVGVIFCNGIRFYYYPNMEAMMTEAYKEAYPDDWEPYDRPSTAVMAEMALPAEETDADIDWKLIAAIPLNEIRSAEDDEHDRELAKFWGIYD